MTIRIMRQKKENVVSFAAIFGISSLYDEAITFSLISSVDGLSSFIRFLSLDELRLKYLAKRYLILKLKQKILYAEFS